MSAQSVADCIFCRIIAGEIPSVRVYENADVFAFLDINPIAVGHTLLVPKIHCATLADMPESVGPAMMKALACVGKAVMSATGADGFNCLQNNFAAAGQMVFHSHWHIIPRHEGDGLTHWPHKSNIDQETMQRTAEAIQRALA